MLANKNVTSKSSLSMNHQWANIQVNIQVKDKFVSTIGYIDKAFFSRFVLHLSIVELSKLFVFLFCCDGSDRTI